MSVFCIEFLLGSSDEVVISLILDQVDGAAAKAAAHDARTGHAALAGHIVEVVQLLAAHFIVP